MIETTHVSAKPPETVAERMEKMTEKQFNGELRRIDTAHSLIQLVMRGKSTYGNDPYIVRKHGPSKGLILK